MKALRWYGKCDVRVESVPKPRILHPKDAIVRVTLSAICGSDLHIYGGFIPTMKPGDILGHEFMGVVDEVGPLVTHVKPGDRVVVAFSIACGECFFCQKSLWALCERSNPNRFLSRTLFGYPTSGLFGYSRIFGGYAGGQAEYVRVPFADVGTLKIPDALSDEQALFLSDIFPTGYMAAENCGIRVGDVVAVWGCGPVGLLAMKSARLQGAAEIIAIDRFSDRLQLARTFARARTIDYTQVDVLKALRRMTDGRGPDACIDAVGMEAHGRTVDAWYDRVKQALYMETDRAHALRQMIRACRNGGTISIPGVYSGTVDKFPLGVAFAKGLTLKMGQTHIHKYMRPLLNRILNREIDPTAIISHRLTLNDAPDAYRMFQRKQHHCTKVVLKP